jgi:phospholipase A1/A2
MKRWLVCCLMLLALSDAICVHAADVDIVLVPSRQPARGGSLLALEIYLHNNTDFPQVRELPLSVPCRIETQHSVINETADLADGNAAAGPIDIPGRGFVRRAYLVPLPVFAAGPVSIILDAIDTNPIMVKVEKAPAEAWVGQQVPLDEGPTMLQSFLDAFSAYEPMYFLAGVDPGLDQSKFQFSFNYRLFNPRGYLADIAPWISGFRLAYTQRSIWDLKNDSKPFEDTSYMPELFYLLPKIDLHIDRVSAFGVQVGFQHESNGKGGTDSRSTNYLYIKPTLGIHLGGPYHLEISPKVFAYVDNEDENNGDLDDYRGNIDLEIGLIDPESLALYSHLWWGDKGGSIQLDLTYPMNALLGKNLNFYLQAQYFNGYAESLIHYDERHDAFRLGFAIVR